MCPRIKTVGTWTLDLGGVSYYNIQQNLLQLNRAGSYCTVVLYVSPNLLDYSQGTTGHSISFMVLYRPIEFDYAESQLAEPS